MKKDVKEIQTQLATKEKRRAKASQKFITALAVVSISEFAGIVANTIFNYNISFYTEAFLMFVIGVALVMDSDYKVLRSLRNGLSKEKLNHLTTAVVGIIALAAGIFSLPQLRIEHPLFLSIKGIISIIAIVVIIVQTWFSNSK